MSAIVIEAFSLTKSFADGFIAVKDLDLTVKRGAVYGLIGRNGSGKTTTLRLLLGLLRPDRGVARILGRDFWQAPHSVREQVAYVSQAQRLPGGMTLEEMCRCHRRFNQRWDPDHARALANQWELPWNRSMGSLSNGEQRSQRCCWPSRADRKCWCWMNRRQVLIQSPAAISWVKSWRPRPKATVAPSC